MSKFSNVFRAFKSRNYQLFFWGQLVSRVGMWMQRTAVIWLVYSMTRSVFMVGVATFAEQFPSFILSPLGGVVADRLDRFKVLMTTQVISALQAVVLTILYVMNYHQVWLILLLSVILGIANAFDVPARQPMVNDLVQSPDDLPNAIAINSALNNLARLLGPALAGWMIAEYGAALCFGSNALSFVAVIVALNLMKLPRQMTDKDKTAKANLQAGIRYVQSSPDIGYTLALAFLVCFLVAGYNTLLPAYAKDVFNGDAGTFGTISAAIGIGAFASTVYIAGLQPSANLKRILWINLCVLAVALICFSYMPSYYIALLILFFCGFGTMSIIPICNTIIQVRSKPEMRGRVISFFAMAAFGALPLGSLLIGWLSEYVGVKNCILFQGIIQLLIAIAFYRFLFLERKKDDASICIGNDMASLQEEANKS